MNFKSTIVQLYFLLIYTDGKVNQGEIALGKKMMKAEGIMETEFNAEMEALKGKDAGVIYKECVASLKRLKTDQQIRSIAWLCVLANSDGFMDKSEWQFIYKVYHKELHLRLDDVMEAQRKLSLITRDALYLSATLSAASETRTAGC